MTGQGDFAVEIPSAFFLLYRERDREMKVEVDFRDPMPRLYRSAIRTWQYPHESKTVTDDDRERILSNIATYLRDVRRFDFEISRDQP